MSAKQLTLTLLVIGAALGMSACDATPSPEQYARARQVDVATEATATVAAIDSQARATAAAWQARATDTAWTLSVQATQTAVPYNAPRVGASAATDITKEWAVTVLGVTGGLFVAVLLGLAFVAMVRTRAAMIPRDASGQLPGVLMGNTLTDPQRQIGPAVTMPQKPDLLFQVERVVHYLKSGVVLPLPESRVTLTDAGATADHLLEAARIAGQVTTAAAVFRPGDPKERKEKIELLVKRDGGRLLGGSRMPEVKMIDDPAEVAKFRKVLELEGGEL